MVDNADKTKHHYARREEQKPISRLFAQVCLLHRCAQSQGSKTHFHLQLMMVEALIVSLPKFIFCHPVPQLISRTSSKCLLYNF